MTDHPGPSEPLLGNQPATLRALLHTGHLTPEQAQAIRQFLALIHIRKEH